MRIQKCEALEYVCGDADPSFKSDVLAHTQARLGFSPVRRVGLADGVVVGRIMRVAAAPQGRPWLWTLAFGYHEDRTAIYGYEATREAAMAAVRHGATAMPREPRRQGLIPNPIDQNPWAHWRSPMDMMRQG
jgi:hypothetical protein